MTQCEMIVQHLKEGFSLTVKSAMEKFGIYALSQRCGEINKNPKKYGIEIVSQTVHDPITGKHYSCYFGKPFLTVEAQPAQTLQQQPAIPSNP